MKFRLRNFFLILVCFGGGSAHGGLPSPHLTFSAQAGEFSRATEDYKDIWDKEGPRITATLARVSGLSFAENEISVIVYEGASYSGGLNEPIYLRASHSHEVKKEALIHELGHKMQFDLPLTPEIDLHRALFLFLYDVWTDLYGAEFANQSVVIEKSRKGFYDYEAAWNWALSFSREQRAKILSDLIQDKNKDHFVDSQGNRREDLNLAWQNLGGFFAEDRPARIGVKQKFFPFGNSRFNCETGEIFINASVPPGNSFTELVTHEGSHICLCVLTNKFNLQESSRFWDEGLATLLQYRFKGQEASYKKRALALASEQLAHKNLSFDLLAHWSTYAKNSSGRINDFAYGVGSSFDYFIIDTYGEQNLKNFLKDLGETQNFAKSLQNIFHTSPEGLEKAWKDSLLQVHSKENL